MSIPTFPAAENFPAVAAAKTRVLAAVAYRNAARTRLGDGTIVKPALRACLTAITFPAFETAVSITNGRPNYIVIG